MVVGIFVIITEHSSVRSGKTGITGTVVSLIITFWIAMDVFPFPSSKTQFII